MDGLLIVLSVFIAINILMNSAAYNSFDSYYNAQIGAFSVIDESIRDAMRSGVMAGMLALSPFSGQAKDTISEKPTTSIEQVAKTYSGFTASQTTNILVRTLYLEAKSEGTSGIDAVASVILNRSGGKPENFPTVCLKPYQFSCWNGLTDAGRKPLTFVTKTPKSAKQKGINQKTWQYCEKIAKELMDGNFKSTIGTRNAYHTTDSYPHWDASMKDTMILGRHKFGYLPEYDGYKKSKSVKQTPKPEKPKVENKNNNTGTTIYKIQPGDQLGKIAVRFKTTTAKLLELNPQYNNNPNFLKIGDKIIVPGAK